MNPRFRTGIWGSFLLIIVLVVLPTSPPSWLWGVPRFLLRQACHPWSVPHFRGRHWRCARVESRGRLRGTSREADLRGRQFEAWASSDRLYIVLEINPRSDGVAECWQGKPGGQDPFCISRFPSGRWAASVRRCYACLGPPASRDIQSRASDA
jgi:hypothetical protein